MKRRQPPFQYPSGQQGICEALIPQRAIPRSKHATLSERSSDLHAPPAPLRTWSATRVSRDWDHHDSCDRVTINHHDPPDHDLTLGWHCRLAGPPGPGLGEGLGGHAEQVFRPQIPLDVSWFDSPPLRVNLEHVKHGPGPGQADAMAEAS
mmetsp:Transcript_3462/g.8270  ORF Transcript_3462/g.8270 Transcript_3462/m.8270 type:complete len:150 (-) Transcript_3462:139-588(-)